MVRKNYEIRLSCSSELTNFETIHYSYSKLFSVTELIRLSFPAKAAIKGEVLNTCLDKRSEKVLESNFS